MTTATELRATFGGEWERGEREIWGLVEHEGRQLKIELLLASKWRCSIFERGACVASSSHEDPVVAVRSTLDGLER